MGDFMETEIIEIFKNNIQYIKHLSKQYPNIQSVCSEIINLEAILNLPKGTEHFLSDIHGEYEEFIHVLNNGSGVIKRKIDDIFGHNISVEEKLKLATLIYYPDMYLDLIEYEGDNLDNWYRMTLHRLIRICRVISSKYTRSKVRKALPKDFAYIIEELLHEQESTSNKQAYYDQIINSIIEIDRAHSFISAICELIQRLAIDHLHITGDIYDRGPGAEIVLDKLMNYHSVDIQFGNHDIIWMGAASGSLVCIANVIRISLRYGNLKTLEEGYGINLMNLARFALDTYDNDECLTFKPNLKNDHKLTQSDIDMITKMHKAISIIQFKVEGAIIKQNPSFEMEDRLLLDKIDYEAGTITIENKTYKLNSNNFPTINPDDPFELTKEEEGIIYNLRRLFKTNDKLQTHTNFLYSKGSMILSYNSNLMVHACIPFEEDGSFSSMNIDGESLSGKKLVDKFDQIIRDCYYSDSDEYLDYFYYLWQGRTSPLFGKSKMTTFERYFINDKQTWQEDKNSYFKFRENVEMCDKILTEFGLPTQGSHIINGHEPVKVSEGESPVKANGKLLVIDGGLSKAYQHITGIAGYTLIYNSFGLLLVEHQAFTTTEDCVTNNRDIISSGKILEINYDRIRVKETDIGKEIIEEINGLNMLLNSYRAGLIKEKA